MTTNDKTTSATSSDGAVEIAEAKLEQAAGGASDFLLEIDGVKGESESRKVPGLKVPGPTTWPQARG